MGKPEVLPVIPMWKSSTMRVGVYRSHCRMRNMVELCCDKLRKADLVACQNITTEGGF
jgi:hypothetical protein